MTTGVESGCYYRPLYSSRQRASGISSHLSYRVLLGKPAFFSPLDCSPLDTFSALAKAPTTALAANTSLTSPAPL